MEQLAKYARQFQTEAEIIGLGRQVAQRIEVRLASLEQSKDGSDRLTVLTSLANAVVLNLLRYKVGADLSLVAWITRNIFELETILAFVTASSENLKSFANDAVHDEIQNREAVRELGIDRSDPERARRQDEAIERLRKQKAELGLTQNRPMKTSEMARAIGPDREKEHQAFNKFYSKVVHPTAYLLMGGKLESTNWEEYRSLVMLQGMQKAGEFCKLWCQELYGSEPGGEGDVSNKSV